MPLPMWKRPGVAYNVGDVVTLYPYEPVRPHGLGQYYSNPLPKDHGYGELRNFVKTDRRHHAKVKITEAIKFGENRKSQIFACQVVEFPSEERPKFYQEPLSIVDPNTKQREPLTRRLVAKAIDYGYFPSSFGGPYSSAQNADGILSRIHAAYAYFRYNKRTGYPHTMPQFYGGWAMKVNGGTDYAGNDHIRLVGLILIEHIHGYSIEELCYRDGGDDGVDTEYLGKLIPSPGPVGFRGNDNQLRHITFDLEKRQLVIQMMLHGLAAGFQIGVEHHHCQPWNVFITMKDGETDLDELRVVFLDHSHTQVWHETKFAEKYGRIYCLQKLPHTPHPFLRCDIDAIPEFHGWWPPAFGDYIEAIPETKNDEWRRYKVFDAWLKKVFGPVAEAPFIRKQLSPYDTKQLDIKQLDPKRPYANKTYSTFELLDYIEETEQAVQAIFRLIDDHPEGERNLEGEKLAKKAIIKGLRPYTISGIRHPTSQYTLPMAYKLSQPTAAAGKTQSLEPHYQA
ncbi:hypothetical protein GQ607_017359 [Colletotrichum asianum]|uniref:Uncharacterized protein n=1 Tax=Colletotrichum asianum TaxID=702518 RepID=A0A8H3VS18_9PEZI|nr:hypothetical protein GQ607_017359 [Colletotrichum asianum]